VGWVGGADVVQKFAQVFRPSSHDTLLIVDQSIPVFRPYWMNRMM